MKGHRRDFPQLPRKAQFLLSLKTSLLSDPLPRFVQDLRRLSEGSLGQDNLEKETDVSVTWNGGYGFYLRTRPQTFLGASGPNKYLWRVLAEPTALFNKCHFRVLPCLHNARTEDLRLLLVPGRRAQSLAFQNPNFIWGWRRLGEEPSHPLPSFPQPKFLPSPVSATGGSLRAGASFFLWTGTKMSPAAWCYLNVLPEIY